MFCFCPTPNYSVHKIDVLCERPLCHTHAHIPFNFIAFIMRPTNLISLVHSPWLRSVFYLLSLDTSQPDVITTHIHSCLATEVLADFTVVCWEVTVQTVQTDHVLKHPSFTSI